MLLVSLAGDAFISVRVAAQEHFCPSLEAYDRQYLSCLKSWQKVIDWECELFLGQTGEGHATVSLDPWGGISQACGFVPVCSELLPGASQPGDVLKPLPEFPIGAWIPTSFRWAECLGLGTNRFYWDVQSTDPFLEARGHTIAEGYLMLARSRITLTGRFHLNDPVAPNLTETFRRSVDTRTVLPVGVIRNELLTDVIHYKVGDLPLQTEFRSTVPMRNPWGRERWHVRFPEEAYSVQMSPRQAEAHERVVHRVEALVAEQLSKLALRVVDAVKHGGSFGNPCLDDFFQELEQVHEAALAVNKTLQDAGHLDHLCAQRDAGLLLTQRLWKSRLAHALDGAPMLKAGEHASLMKDLRSHLQFHLEHHVADR